MTANDLTIYSSDGRIVVGLQFSADLPRGIFDTTGWAYLTATPNIDRTISTLHFPDLKIKRILDNELWNVLSAVFSEQLTTRLRQGMQFELKTLENEYARNLSEAINSAELIEELNLRVRNLTVAAHNATVESEALVAVIRLSANVETGAAKVGTR